MRTKAGVHGWTRLLACVLLGLVSCSPRPQRRAPGRPTLVVLSRLWSTPHEKDFIKTQILRPFEREHRCSIDFQTLDDTALLKRAQVQQEAGSVATDVVIVYVSRMHEWVSRGYVEALGALKEEWPDRTFAAEFRDKTDFNGRRFFLPIGADDYLLCADYRALRYLPEGADVQSLHWRELADWAIAVARGEGEGKFAVSAVPQKLWTYQAAAAVLSFGGGFPDVGSPAAREAWGVFERMAAAGAFSRTVRTYDSVVEPLKRGEAWLTVTHNARVGEIYSSAPAQYAIAPPPRGDAGVGSVVGFSGIGVMKGAPHPELARAFLDYLTHPGTQVKLAQGTGGFIPTVMESVALLGDSYTDEVIRHALRVLDSDRLAYIPVHPNWGSVKQLYDDLLADLLQDGRLAPDALDAAQRRLDTLMAEGQ